MDRWNWVWQTVRVFLRNWRIGLTAAIAPPKILSVGFRMFLCASAVFLFSVRMLSRTWRCHPCETTCPPIPIPPHTFLAYTKRVIIVYILPYFEFFKYQTRTWETIFANNHNNIIAPLAYAYMKRYRPTAYLCFHFMLNMKWKRTR